MATEYYYSRDGQTFGPHSGGQLKKLAAQGTLQPTDLIWSPEKNAWIPASSIKGLFASNGLGQHAAVALIAAGAPRQSASALALVPAVASAPFGNIAAAGLSDPRLGRMLGVGAGVLIGLVVLVWAVSALMRSSDTASSNPVALADKKDAKDNETKSPTDNGKSDNDKKAPPVTDKNGGPKTEPKAEPKTEPKVEADAAAPHLERGNALFAKADMEGAIRAYSEAIKVQPTSAWAYCKRGQAHMNKGEFQRAIDDCNKSLELNPRLVDAYAFRSASEYDSKDFAAAIATATLALKVDAKAPFFYFLRGSAFVQTNAPQRALDDLDEAIRLDPKNPRFYNIRGAAHAKLGNKQKAQADYDQADSLQLASMSPAKRQAYQRMLQAEATFKQASALYEADYRRYEVMRNTYQAQAGRAAAMGIKLQPPTPTDPALEQQMRNAQAAFVQARRVFEQTP